MEKGELKMTGKFVKTALLSACIFCRMTATVEAIDFKEDFNNERETSSWLGGNGIRVSTSETAAISVSEKYAFGETGKGLRILNSEKSSNGELVGIEFDIPLNNEMLEFKLKRPKSYSGRLILTIGPMGKSMSVFLSFIGNKGYAYCGSKVLGGSATRRECLGSFKPGKWYKIGVRCDMGEDAYQVWIDDKPVLPWSRFYHNLRMSTKEKKKVFIGFRGAWGKADWFLDDITVRSLDNDERDGVAETLQDLNKSNEKDDLEAKLSKTDGLFMFDFGTPKSKVPKGFIKITQKTSFNENARYGWKKTEGLKSVAYGEKNGFITTLNGDIVFSKKERTFKLFLKKGDYGLWITPNCPRVYIPAWSLSVDGKKTLDPVDLPHQTCVFTISKDKVVSFTCSPNGPPFGKEFQIAAMIVYPLSAYNLVRRLIQRINKEALFGNSETLARYDLATEKRAPKPHTADGKRCVLFTIPSLSPIHPDKRPLPREIAKKLNISAAGGECAAATFGLYAVKNLLGVKMELDRPPSNTSAGSEIPKSRIAIRSAEYYLQPAKNKFGGFRSDLASWGGGLLKKAQSANIAADSSKQFLISIDVPKNTPPGLYKTLLKLKDHKGVIFNIPLRLKVLPFSLPELGLDHSFFLWYLGAYRKPSLPYLQREIWDMRKHGCNLYMIPTRTRGVRIIKKKNGIISFDLSKLEQFLQSFFQIVRSLEIESDTPVIYPFPANFLNKDLAIACGVSKWSKHINSPLKKGINVKYKRALTDFIIQLEKLRARHGWPEFLYYPIDEPYSVEKSKLAWILLETIKKAAKVRTFCTLVQPGNYFKPLEPVVDVRVYNGGDAFKDSNKLRALAEKDGAEYWLYGMHYDKAKWTIVNHARFRWGFAALKLKCGANGFWIYEWSKGNFLNAVAGLNGLIYPLAEGTVPSLRWENFRRGVEDYKYYFLLKRILNTPSLAGKKGFKKLRATAEKDMRNIMKSIDPEATPVIDDTVMDEWRSRLTRWIIAALKFKNGGAE
jgi:hypothetical protein